MRQQSQEIGRRLMERIFRGSIAPVAEVAGEIGLSRQAVQRHMARLERDGLVRGEGRARWRRYLLANVDRAAKSYALDGGVTEDRVWDGLLRKRIAGVDVEAADILHYGATEIINNAIDHSNGSRLHVELVRTAISSRLAISDDGIGVFRKIAEAAGLADLREAPLELVKGKFTTDPKRHTGEGLFFTSRVFDRFEIRSGGVWFSRSSHDDQCRIAPDEPPAKGSRLVMELLLPTTRKLEAVFSRYSSGPDDYRFSRTDVPLKLAAFGDEGLVSRSSARRVLSRIERFDEVVLDFAGIRSVGQAFADEVFRVFAADHPQTRLVAVNANETVTLMIRRAEAAARQQAR